MPLTKRELEVLEATVAFGGYVSRTMLQEYLHVSQQRASFLLSSLAEQKHLACVYARAQEPSIYQVTYRSCKLLGCPHSFMRRQHKPPVMRRNLLRAHFLFANTKLEEYSPVSTTSKRIAYLKSLGVDDGLIPRKYNRAASGQQVAVLQVEESFLLLPPFSPEGGLCIVHFDQHDADTRRQLAMLLDRYVPLIRSRLVPLAFLVVTEDEIHARTYAALYAKLMPREAELKPKLTAFSIDYAYDFSL
jgi:hypothetical protein